MRDCVEFLKGLNMRGKDNLRITFNNEVVGHAFRHDKLYLLFIQDSINVVSFENDVNVSSSKNKHKK
jgi:hypothetical protein